MMHTVFGSKYIGVGEDHKGKHGFDFKKKDHTDKLHTLFATAKSEITCWFEGPNASKKSPSFINFIKELKLWQNKHNEFSKIRIIEKGWELSLKFDRMEELTGIMLGAEVYEYAKLLGNQLNGKQPLAHAFVNAKTIKGSQSSPIKLEELIKCLSDQSGMSDILNEMIQPDSAKKETLEKIYGGSYNAMRAKYFEGTPGAKTSSSIYKRVDNFNRARDKHLANLMRTKGGIFLAGDGHIEFIDKFL